MKAQIERLRPYWVEGPTNTIARNREAIYERVMAGSTELDMSFELRIGEPLSTTYAYTWQLLVNGEVIDMGDTDFIQVAKLRGGKAKRKFLNELRRAVHLRKQKHRIRSSRT